MAQQGSSSKRSVKESVHLDFLRKAMEWVVDQSIFQNLKTHGNITWIAKDLVMLAVLWVWSEKSQLTAAFEEAAVWSKRLFGGVAVGSYQSLTNALVRYGGQLVPLLWNRLHQLMEQVADDHWRIGLWLAIAVDGSRVSTPRTKANEKAFRAANYGKSNSAKYRKKKSKNKRKENRVKAETVTPQIWITLLWVSVTKLSVLARGLSWDHFQGFHMRRAWYESTRELRSGRALAQCFSGGAELDKLFHFHTVLVVCAIKIRKMFAEFGQYLGRFRLFNCVRDDRFIGRVYKLLPFWRKGGYDFASDVAHTVVCTADCGGHRFCAVISFFVDCGDLFEHAQAGMIYFLGVYGQLLFFLLHVHVSQGVLHQ